jgi:hypothetical protein
MPTTHLYHRRTALAKRSSAPATRWVDTTELASPTADGCVYRTVAHDGSGMEPYATDTWETIGAAVRSHAQWVALYERMGYVAVADDQLPIALTECDTCGSTDGSPLQHGQCSKCITADGRHLKRLAGLS